MSKWAKFWDKIEAGQSDNNINFMELVTYLERLGGERSALEQAIECTSIPWSLLPSMFSLAVMTKSKPIKSRKCGKRLLFLQETT